jgi:SAM-dependent methyltransferase
VEAFASLLMPEGQAVLQAAMQLCPREVDFLAHFQSLSRQYPVDLVRAALEIAILRIEAVGKFPFADQLYLTREALEQASGWQVSSYRAQRYRDFVCVADLGCSVGGDTLALAQVAQVIGIDLDKTRLQMARANLDALNLGERVILAQADLKVCLPLKPSTALFFDPARRQKGRRVRSVLRYQPPLGVVRNWLKRFPALGVKISPGVRMAELAGYDAEVEFISLRGELKEAVLWFGALKRTGVTATLLPGPHTLTAPVRGISEQPDSPTFLSEPLAYLYEPDPAILRAGLVRDLGERLGAAQLDADIAYLTADQYTSSPFARAWQVETWFPFGLKRLRSYLREHHVGQVVVKKRGSPMVPEQLIQQLRLQGEEARSVFLTHLRGKPIVIVAGVNPVAAD